MIIMCYFCETFHSSKKKRAFRQYISLNIFETLLFGDFILFRFIWEKCIKKKKFKKKTGFVKATVTCLI